MVTRAEGSSAPQNEERDIQADHDPGPTCSDSHIPGYIKHPKIKDAGKVFVVSVNDPFV
jgi:hypothetical protein